MASLFLRPSALPLAWINSSSKIGATETKERGDAGVSDPSQGSTEGLACPAHQIKLAIPYVQLEGSVTR